MTLIAGASGTSYGQSTRLLETYDVVGAAPPYAKRINDQLKSSLRFRVRLSSKK